MSSKSRPKIVLFYPGEDYYYRSDTAMSSIYRKVPNGLERWDWGKLEMALERGFDVIIKQPSLQDRLWAQGYFHYLMEQKGKGKPAVFADWSETMPAEVPHIRKRKK